jgi:hypothetical protein
MGSSYLPVGEEETGIRAARPRRVRRCALVGRRPNVILCAEGPTCDSPRRSPAQTADVPRVRRPRETFAISFLCVEGAVPA